MNWPTGAVGNAVGDHSVGRGRNVGAARTGPIATLNPRNEIPEPKRSRISVIVDKRNNFAGGGRQAQIACVAEPAVWSSDQTTITDACVQTDPQACHSLKSALEVNHSRPAYSLRRVPYPLRTGWYVTVCRQRSKV